jgi:orotate phosphoribosyltransferase
MFFLDRSPLHLSPPEQTDALLELISQLAYREGTFTLTSGRTSSYYINCKPVTLHPQGAYLIGQKILPLLPAETQAIAGMTLGADPILSAVSLASLSTGQNLPALIVRKQPKQHGTQAWLEGMILPPKTCVWILEDVVTSGGSALKAAERVREAGYDVGGILTLIDRQEGGEKAIQQAGFLFRSVFTLRDIRLYFQTHCEKN